MLWTFQLALRQLFPIGRKFPFYSIISILGVTLGVALLVIVEAVMLGFGREHREKIIATTGHVQIFGDSYFQDAEEWIGKLQEDPEVESATPFVVGKLMILFRDRPAFPNVRGSDLQRETSVLPIDKYMVEGKWDDLDDSTVFLGQGLARNLGATVGSKIEVYSPLMIHRFEKDEVFMPRELEVAGIFSTGWHTFDNELMLLSKRQLQELFGLNDAVHGISIRLADSVDVDAFCQRWNQLLPGSLFAYSWMDLNHDFLWILQFERNMIFFLLIFVVLVSAFAIMSSLMNHVVTKTREIGLLRSLGAKPSQIAALFCFQGLWVGIIGTTAGIIIGWLAVHFRLNIITFFNSITGGEAAMARFYQFAEIPAYIAPMDVIKVALTTLLLATLAGVVPAIRAARLKPADALRNEY
jgi:lipoprotein-releasing system permease protein